MGIFHRYDSTIHGNYRRAYLRGGLLTGALLGGYVLVRMLMGKPVQSPTSLISDIALLVAVFLFTAYYRNSLDEKKITLKEAMLFGMGLSLVASFLYGALLYVVEMCSSAQTVLFTTTMTGQEITSEDPQLHYWAAWWAIMSFLEMLLLGCFGAFVAAVLFRNEKSTPRNKKTNQS